MSKELIICNPISTNFLLKKVIRKKLKLDKIILHQKDDKVGCFFFLVISYTFFSPKQQFFPIYPYPGTPSSP